MIEGSTPRALALGATLALGSCGLTACGEEPSEPPPPLAVAAPVEAEPTPEPVEPEATELALESDAALLGVHELGPGFVPDPLTLAGERTASSVDANRHDDRCVGWVAGLPTRS